MRLLGAVEDNLDASYMQKSLMLYPELMRDKYNREIVKDVKRSLVKWGKAGKLAIDGKYCFLAPDLYAFCEWLFLGEENPQGLLADGEVACSLYRDGDELDCLRSPHLYKEHAIRKNIQNDLINKWFDTKCIYTSCHDLISKVLMFDCDGDKSLIVKENIIFSIFVKCLVMILSALGFANIVLGIVADVGVMILAVLNSIRILYIKK